METKGGMLISRIKQLQDRIFGKILAEQGLDINGPQGRILFVLWEKDRLTVTEIGRRTSLANTSLTGMLDRMAAMGIVERQPDPENRRQITICLTQKAREMRRDFEGVSQKMNEIFYWGFSDREIAGFEDVLEKILFNLRRWEETRKKSGRKD
ncbi:MarR family winged helix-turn-helix transcriptional regulator [Breznakiella homolactica]|uniref:MarR family transcriptional regulator n=1 Tax=Breznakiella homolactica TaxID=2798577 RepID=A0A7T8BB56_9SPIR|nr:MarR family transcriptional regulator [Breznakiella homolactica]QQO10056.1 MarR family transcriptional regulator [Breznakiella homolactica]